MTLRARLLAVVIATALIVAGCTVGDTPAPTSSRPADNSATAPDSPAPDETTATQSPTPTEPPHPVSLPALMEAGYDGDDLDVGNVLDETSEYTRYAVTYKSGDLTVSGIMNVPDGDGPFPVLVLAHGYIDPDIYTTGRGLAREQDYLARQGYVALHTDFRNHAGSDADPDAEVELRLGYTEDVINAVYAVQNSDLPYLDGDRVGLLGRSMGGGVVYNALVAAPGLVDAAVVYAPVSSDAADNFRRWQRGEPTGDEIVAEHGRPADEPEFWNNASPRPFFDRISEPLLIHHGTADESCPIEWSRETLDALIDAGVDAELIVYDGEPHAFVAEWQQSIEVTADFFDQRLA